MPRGIPSCFQNNNEKITKREKKKIVAILNCLTAKETDQATELERVASSLEIWFDFGPLGA